MKKPINIAFELVAIIIIIFMWLLNIFKSFDKTWILTALLITYLIGIISITMRTLIKKKEDQRFSSAFIFGLFNGACFGIFLFFLDTHTQYIDSYLLLIGVPLWALAGGFIATLISYLISMRFLKDIFKVVHVIKERK